MGKAKNTSRPRKENEAKRKARRQKLGIQETKKVPSKKLPWRPREWTDDDIDLETEALVKWMKNPSNYYLTGFLIERDLDTSHLDRFAQRNEMFRLALLKAKKVQEQRLVELAVSKKGDGGFIKFVLQNKAGWKEKQEVSGDAANPLAIIMDRIAESAKDPLDYGE